MQINDGFIRFDLLIQVIIFFQDLPSHQHPVIVLRDTSFLELKSLLSFIYHGEVNVSQDRLGLLLKTAESLRIKGLAQDKRARDLEQVRTLVCSRAILV